MEEDEFEVGGFYEDCAYHPCLCTAVGGLSVQGISLVDGSTPRSCDIGVCGVRPLTVEEAISIRQNGPSNEEDRKSIPKKDRWW